MRDRKPAFPLTHAGIVFTFSYYFNPIKQGDCRAPTHEIMRRFYVFLSIMLLPVALHWSAHSASAVQKVVVADFSSGLDRKGVPPGWKLKERSGKADISIVREGPLHALRLRSNDTSFSIQKPVNLNPLEYPLLTWKWKVTQIPDGGDFRKRSADDQAAQLFMAFSNSNILVYIWDSSAPQGLTDDAWAPPFLTIKAIVVRSGRHETGKWLTETRNIYDDYRNLFGGEPPRIAGIRIQINSQHTDSSGESYFADISFERLQRFGSKSRLNPPGSLSCLKDRKSKSYGAEAGFSPLRLTVSPTMTKTRAASPGRSPVGLALMPSSTSTTGNPRRTRASSPTNAEPS